MHLVSWRSWFGTCVLSVFILCLCLGTVASAKPKKTSAKPKETITYVVVKGDSVDKIAKKFEVRSDDIVRWNNLADASRIRIGQKLKIRVAKGSYVQPTGKGGSSRPAEITENVYYIVKKGDNLGKIARKTGVTIEQLKKNNKALAKNPDKLRVGQKLVVDVKKRFAGATGVSRGLANNGSLVGGIQMQSGPGYVVRNPKRSYGTALSVSLIMDAMQAYANRYPKAPRFMIGDLSTEKGGKLSPHLSHQSGRDVDISYIHTSNKENLRFERMSHSTLDIEKNWFVLEYFLKSGKVQYIFVDYDLQSSFYNYAKSKGYSDAQLKTMIQYPNGKKSYHAIMRHSKGHADHFHVRFVCASSDVNCH
ncbi:MAG: penicillin-insensitive murein endopeptidase [Proteobacteria bacterium]|jgi:LysM repeat protein|nr:penicillin-insensitive murein endopeptidase [Pseudomonadota bacterium]